MKKTKTNNILKITLITILSLIILLLCVAIIFINIAISPVKNIDLSLTKIDNNYSKIVDINGEVLPYLNNIKENYTYIEDIPEYTKSAFIAIEDKKFYSHNGINLKRIAGAIYKNLKSGSLKEGASTITQQLVKNKFLTNEKTIDRKIKEAYLSLKLEKQESKDKIFESYLNTIYFGNGAYGIGDACQTYFGKTPNQLTLSESAMLAGIIRAPNSYSPFNNYSKAKNRQELVLKEMLEDKYIDQIDYENAVSAEVDMSNSNPNYNYKSLDLYTQFVINEASEILNTSTHNILYGGYTIETYQDNNVQNELDKAINDAKNYHINSFGNTADSLSIIINNETNGVSAVSGKSNYNLLNIKRQPGSLIKPVLVYMPALEEGVINAKTQILDEKIEIDGYAPNNVGNIFHGYISTEDAVAQSLNIPTIKIASELGLKKCKNYAQKTGIKFNEKNDNGYAITLGGFTDGITLKDITDSYSTLTHNGFYQKSKFIKSINKNNFMSYDSNLLSISKIYNDDTIYIMTEILNYSVKNGTSKKLSKFNYDIAGKTGTVAVKGTNLNTDAYSLAYTTQHTMSVWLGNYTMNEQYNLEGKNNGGTYATQIISDVFNNIYKYNTPQDFSMPNSVETINIDAKTLTEDHIVVLGDNIPDRYKTKMHVSQRYMPKQSSTKFTYIIPFQFDIQTYKNSCEIIFDAYDYQNYYLYRIENGKEKLLKVFKNKNEKIIYSDTSILPNIDYSYYILCKSNYSNSEYKTLEKNVNIKKEYSTIIDKKNEQDNISWLFS